MVSGHSKGATAERKLCALLSRWISDGKRTDLLWRTAMSGGRATVGLKKGEKRPSQFGDITAVDALGHQLTDLFMIESKHYRDLNIDKFIFGQGKLADFWIRACQDAEHAGKHPMLIARQNRFPSLVVTVHVPLFPIVPLTYVTPLGWKRVVPSCMIVKLDDLVKLPFKDWLRRYGVGIV